MITRGTNLANISTPIHNDLMLIQDKRFKHLAQSFIDPRSPSEGIVRTPIVIKSTDISSIVNTPRILEEDFLAADLLEDDNNEDFQKTFEEALSRMSFDDCLEGEDESPKDLPTVIETHFDCVLDQPLKPLPLPLPISSLKHSALDPRSPTTGIDRTPLAFAGIERQRKTSIDIVFSGTLQEAELEEEDKEKNSGTVESVAEVPPAKSAEVFVDVGQVIYGTPVQMAANGPIQQRTPLSCLANRRKRIELNGKAGESPKSQKKSQTLLKENCNELKVKKSATNPFETSLVSRKSIR